MIFSATAGFDVGWAPNICGSDEDGNDVSNDPSCMAMEALANLHVCQPPICLLYHRDISPDVVERAIDLNRMGSGQPALSQSGLDGEVVPDEGLVFEDAKRVQLGCCVNPHIRGRAVTATGIANVGAVFGLKLLRRFWDCSRPPICPASPSSRTRARCGLPMSCSMPSVSGCCST